MTNSIGNYYKTNFLLIQHHKYSLTEIENMIPYELDIYIEWLNEYMEKLDKEQNK